LHATQPDLLAAPADVPAGFEYRSELISADEERALLEALAHIEFSNVEMRGVVARRRTAHFGWTYGYYSRRSEPGVPLPAFLLPLRIRVAAWSGHAPDDYTEALVTEYPAGAPIGWHRDAPMFGDIAGVSLVAAATMRFRPYLSPDEATAKERASRRFTHQIILEPRSGYLIRGVARNDYEHHIPGVERLRYSITFRTLRK
jgi:alkylated DNA repair dioxygenase AlkB